MIGGCWAIGGNVGEPVVVSLMVWGLEAFIFSIKANSLVSASVVSSFSFMSDAFGVLTFGCSGLATGFFSTTGRGEVTVVVGFGTLEITIGLGSVILGGVRIG